MADALGRPIGLIPCARGGTSLHEWSEMEKGSADSLYGAMLERIGRAGGRLRGVLWYQGESDTNEETDACSYAERLDRWIAALRRDTGMPDLPVAVVQIGRVLQPKNGPEREPGWNMVREALRTLPERIPHTAVTSAVDLPLGDSIHVSTEGLIRLGRRLARLALRLTGRVDISAGPRVREIESWTTSEGGKNGLRVTFDGVTGGWTRTDSIGGFAFHPAEPGPGALPPMMINARVDAEAGDDSVLILLDREPGPGERVSYAAGFDPRCDLVDRADMPLCSFLPRPVD
jgi:sialate O-acetylesterase